MAPVGVQWCVLVFQNEVPSLHLVTFLMFFILVQKCHKCEHKFYSSFPVVQWLSQVWTFRLTLQESDESASMTRCSYFIHSVCVCRKSFLFLHCMSHVRFDNLMSHYKEFGLCTRTHGNNKCQPAHTFSFNDISHLTTFITNFARAHGSCLPGRVPGHRDKVMILPADITKVFVYSKYKQACVEKGVNTSRTV